MVIDLSETATAAMSVKRIDVEVQNIDFLDVEIFRPDDNRLITLVSNFDWILKLKVGI